MLIITPQEALEQAAAAMRQRRIGQRLTQEDLAEKSGVALASLRKFERTGLISLESFFKLATTLSILETIVKSIETEDEYASLDEMLKQKKKNPRTTARQRVKPGKKS